MKTTRFNKPLITIDDALEYLYAKCTQLLYFGVKLQKIQLYEWGLIAYQEYNNKTYQSIIILKNFEGKGIYKQHITHEILTAIDCGIEDYLINNNISYRCIFNGHSYEYSFINEFYGDKKAFRSGVHLMNHIDEGLYILNKIGASIEAQKAYCLHPIIQSDEALLENYSLLNNDNISKIALINAIEYRSVANEYLSTRKIDSIDEIRLSPLKDVNDMLIADKIQNYKDFEKYHKDTHPRSKELTQYFENWLQRLNISKEFYQECVEYCSLNHNKI